MLLGVAGAAVEGKLAGDGVHQRDVDGEPVTLLLKQLVPVGTLSLRYGNPWQVVRTVARGGGGELDVRVHSGATEQPRSDGERGNAHERGGDVGHVPDAQMGGGPQA